MHTERILFLDPFRTTDTVGECNANCEYAPYCCCCCTLFPAHSADYVGNRVAMNEGGVREAMKTKTEMHTTRAKWMLFIAAETTTTRATKKIHEIAWNTEIMR